MLKKLYLFFFSEMNNRCIFGDLDKMHLRVPLRYIAFKTEEAKDWQNSSPQTVKKPKKN